MAKDTSDIEHRIAKVPLPVPLIRRMDEAVVAERGGFRTRVELVREAIENLLNELEFPDAPNEPHQPSSAESIELVETSSDSNSRTSFIEDLVSTVPSWERDELTLADIAGTALRPPADRPRLIVNGQARTSDQPLLGLHNRDYVSLWAAQRLAHYTMDGPLPFQDYLRRLTAAAWYFGAQLQDLEVRGQKRGLTVLLPTNTAKQPSAERGFQNFAVGTVGQRGDDHGLAATGPLFAWGMIQVLDADLLVGLTEAGWDLLGSLEGLSLDLPHPPELMVRFLSHLALHAPADRWGFDHVLRIIDGGPDRETLVASFTDGHPEWTASTASSVAQGYVARGREWGLVEPKLVEGRYWLTDLGRERQRSQSRTTQTPSASKEPQS